MFYVSQVVRIFLMAVILAFAVPVLNFQDTNKSDDGSNQSDNSSDQQNDQAATLNDFLFEDTVCLQEVCLNEISAGLPCAPSDEATSIHTSDIVSFLPHIFISECGLMPRAPTPA
jgi:hypothetical protein